MLAINIAFGVWDGILEKLVASTRKRVMPAVEKVLLYAIALKYGEAADNARACRMLEQLERARLACEDEIANARNRGQGYGLIAVRVHLVMLALVGFLPTYEFTVWIAAVIVLSFMVVSALPLVVTVNAAEKSLLEWERQCDEVGRAAAEEAREDVIKFVGGKGKHK